MSYAKTVFLYFSRGSSPWVEFKKRFENPNGLFTKKKKTDENDK